MNHAWRQRGSGSVRVGRIVAISVAIVALGAGAYALFEYQKSRNTLRLLADADRAASDEDWQAAIVSYRQYLRRNPSDHKALSAYASALVAQLRESPDLVSDAVKVLRQVIAADPQDFSATSQLANIYLELHEFSLAETASARWAESEPSSVDAALTLAGARYGLERYDEASEGLIQAIGRLPAEARLYPPLIGLYARELNQPDDAKRWLDEALRNAADSYEIHLTAFALNKKDGDESEAERHLGVALELAPSSVDVLVAAAAYYTSSGSFARAKELLDRARQQSPGDRRVLAAWSTWAIKTNLPIELDTVAVEMITHARDDELSLIAQAADLFLRAKQLDRADECLARLAANGKATEQLGSWLDALKGTRELLGDRPYSAIPHLESALGDHPGNAHLAGMLAQAFVRIGAIDLATEMYHRITAKSPDSTDSKLALARLELRQGRPNSARHTVNAILDANEDQAHQASVIRLACDLMRAKQNANEQPKLEEHRATLARLSKEAHGGSTTLKLLVDCFLLSDQPGEAIALLRDAMASVDAGADVGAELGRVLVIDQDYETASALADELLVRFPESLAGHELRLKIFAATNRLAEINTYIEGLAHSSSSKLRLWDTAVELYFGSDSGEGAFQRLRDTLASAPQSIALRQRLARATPQLDEALRLVEQIRQLEGDAGLFWKHERAGVLLRLDASEDGIEEATRLLHTCLANRPSWTSAKLLLADARHRSGKLQEAADLYRAAIARHPQLAKGRVALELIQILKELDRFVEADVVLEALASAHPNAPEILRLQTEHHYRNRNLQSAATTAERLLNTKSDDPTWAALTADLHRRANNLDKAEKIARSALKAHPESTAILWSLAQTFISQRRPEKAEDVVREAIARRADAEHHLLLANVLAQLGKHAQAHVEVHRAVEKEPTSAKIWSQAAAIWGLLGERTSQLDFARRAIQLEGLNPDQSVTLAEMLATGGTRAQRLEAGEILRALLTVDPNDVEALTLQGQLAVTDTPPHLAQAAASLTEALSIDPQFAKANRLLSIVQLERGQLEAAHDTISAGLAFAPHDPNLLLVSAEIHCARGDYDQAIPLLHRALELRPRMPQALRLLGDASAKNEQVDRAMSFLDAHAPSETRTPQELVVVARLCEAKGDFAQAESLLRSASENTASSQTAHRELLSFFTRRKRYDDVHSAAAQHSQTHPDDIESLAMAAQILGARSKDDKLRRIGLGWLERIARDHPEHGADAVYKSALCYYETGDLGRAESKFLEALRLLPAAPHIINDLAWLYSEDLDRPADAVALIERFLSGGGTADAHMLDTHGVALTRLGQFDAARQKLAACLRIAGRTPTKTAASYHLGLLLLKTDQSYEGLTYIRRAMELDRDRGGLTAAQKKEADRLTKPTP